MSELYLMVTIINRNLTKKFMDFYTDTGLEVSMTAAGSGTAAILGLKAVRKVYCFML